MRRRPIMRFHPGLERFEAKLLLDAGHMKAHAAKLSSGSKGSGAGAAETTPAQSGAANPDLVPGSLQLKAGSGYFAYRLTNPTYRIIHLRPPFQQVLVQNVQPVPGQTYNILYMVVRNGTSKTFTASDGLTVRIPGTSSVPQGTGQPSFPVLTGNEVWKPNHWIVFYIIGKEYYPLSPQAAGGFQLQAGGRSSTIIPGPSGIFLRLKYNPATFAKTLDWIVAYGQGSQMGNGSAVGMPDTAINILVSAGTRRMDFAGHF